MFPLNFTACISKGSSLNIKCYLFRSYKLCGRRTVITINCDLLQRFVDVRAIEATPKSEMSSFTRISIEKVTLVYLTKPSHPPKQSQTETKGEKNKSSWLNNMYTEHSPRPAN